MKYIAFDSYIPLEGGSPGGLAHTKTAYNSSKLMNTQQNCMNTCPKLVDTYPENVDAISEEVFPAEPLQHSTHLAVLLVFLTGSCWHQGLLNA